ncbi:4731_t:CDS:2, partial [Ambispora leptoticha]
MFALRRATSRTVLKSSIISLTPHKYVTHRTLPALISSSTRFQKYEQRSSFTTTTATRVNKRNGNGGATALVRAIAPNWEAKAFIDGEVKDLSLDKYLSEKRYVVM